MASKEELKQEAKYYAKRLFDEKEQAYLHDMVVRVYMESAEPREKRIAELEKDRDYFSDALDKQIEATLKLDKENAELQHKVDILQGFLDRDIEYQELKQENAELKEYNKYLRRKRQGGIQKQYNKVAIIKQQGDQLAKAQQFIRDFLSVAVDYIDKEDKNYSLIAEAEQFLKESE